MNARTLVYKMQVRLRVIVVHTCEADTTFQVFVSKSVMSINGLSFASARPAPQPCVSVFVVRRIQEFLFIFFKRIAIIGCAFICIFD